jgi:hypothetical protein
MNWEYLPELDINLTISGKKFIENQPIVADDLKNIISDWWTKCRNLYCIIDLKDINVIKLDILSVIHLIQNLEEYNKDNSMLKSIKFINCNFFIKLIYKGVKFGIPKSVRDIIRFS